MTDERERPPKHTLALESLQIALLRLALRGWDDETIKFIVEACNNYENLLRLNEELLDWIRNLVCHCDYHNEIKCDRCSILARAAEVRKERGSDA